MTLKTTIEIEVEIDYNITPGEPCIPYLPDGSGQPGFPPEVEINAVWIKDDAEIVDLLTEKQIKELSEECLQAALEGDEP